MIYLDRKKHNFYISPLSYMHFYSLGWRLDRVAGAPLSYEFSYSFAFVRLKRGAIVLYAFSQNVSWRLDKGALVITVLHLGD